jgi:hypothetical protein
MVLRSLEPLQPSSEEFVPAWNAVMRLQKQHYTECWMITQPSHAALAGQIAAKLSSARLPELGPELVQAIGLHDAGWGMPDAQAIMRSRSVAGDRPKSFLEMSVPEFLSAWKQSIEIAQAGSTIGGYMVSRHFWRLADHWLKTNSSDSEDRALMKKFVDQESKRQARLAEKETRTAQQLEALTDVLQLCDLLSLYFCCGAAENVEFPEFCGVRIRVTASSDGYHLEPALTESGSQFNVAALRHPTSRGKSGQEIEVRIL